ncbi:hypothetical protein EW145_g907 [Phellinidium pouzarii]|uniref:FAM86 N-terminal domain-containing protein n=1 Tax=Phellinidium pouzarii TaxID=167371 RepID=A0A4S4LGK1_9AGAM|nr:hypothetical protein EW145_g907 [Phellinidium pouzarii]
MSYVEISMSQPCITLDEPLLPPSVRLPLIGRLQTYPLADLRTSVEYLRLLYNPEVRGSRRKTAKDLGKQNNGVVASDLRLEGIRADAFERAHAIRWLTTLVVRGDLLAATIEEEDEGGLCDRLVEDAAALLAACAGTAAAGRVSRTFAFGPSPSGEVATVQLSDEPLEKGDYAGFGLPSAHSSVDSDASTRSVFRVLELGAGTGLVGLATAKLLALRNAHAHIYLTDVHAPVLANLRKNTVTNFPYASDSALPRVDIVVTPLDWESFSVIKAESVLGTFDLILGADIVYEALHATWLRACLERLLAPHALFHLLIPLRQTHAFESSTVEQVFSNEAAEGEGVFLLGRKLGVTHQERFVCDAHNGTTDEVEYAYFQIGWFGAVSSAPSLNTDPNTPDVFTQNVKLSLQYAEVISRLANSALAGIEQAFHPAASSNPMAAAADIISARHYIDMFSDFLSQTGVGALPLLTTPSDSSMVTPPDEGALLAQTTGAVTALYARQKQIQENNAVVASLLGASEGQRR